MSSTGKCEECGRAIPGDSPGGFCAQCLLGLGLGEAEPGSGKEGAALKPGDPVPQVEKPGDRIGRYRLLQEIGHGGCGVVYMAEQEVPVRRKVAVKVIKLGMDTRQVVARFEAERQALALMDHQNIAKVLDAGATEVGRPYFVMELVGGVKITEFCDQNNLNTHERIDLFVQVCRAIQHAHQKGILHRDIKPSNVLVAMQDGMPVPKVIDFGIAKATQGRLTDQTLFTAFEQFIGTPVYMSPEQAQLGGIDVDTRSDIYSLGVLLYELLTGKTPFDAEELTGVAVEAMRRTICEKEPPKPSTRVTRELMAAKGDLPRRRSPTRELADLLRGDLDWIVMKCLEKDRARRYETANGLALDLQRYLTQEPIAARPPSKVYQFQKFVRRNQLAVVSAGLIALALMLGVVASTWQAIRATRAEGEQSHLREEAQNARKDATLKLWASYLAEAQARRLSGKSGQRFESLRAIRDATAIRPSSELRNEAIASMVLADIRPARGTNFRKAGISVTTGASLENYAIIVPPGTVKIRRVADDAEVGSLPEVDATPHGVGQFSPDGKYLVVTYKDNSLRLWDWPKREVVCEPGGLATPYDFSADSRLLAASDGTNISIYDIGSRSITRKLSISNLTAGLTGGWLRFDPSGRRLLMTDGTSTNVVILDSETGTPLISIPHEDYLYAISWHPDGRYLATICASQPWVNIWDVASGQLTKKMPLEQPVSATFNHRGTMLATSGWDNKTRLWDFSSGKQLVTIDRSGFVGNFSPDDRTVVISRWDGTFIEFFDVDSGEGLSVVHEDQTRSGPGGNTFFSPDGRLLVHPSANGVAVWDVREGRSLGAVAGGGDFPIGFDAGASHLIVEGARGLGRCEITEVIPGGPLELSKEVMVLSTNNGAAISPDGRICAVEFKKKWRFYETVSFRELAETPVLWAAFGSAMSPDGSLLAVGARHRPGVKVMDSATGALVKDLPADDGHTDTSAGVLFSPDGKTLVTAISTECSFWDTGSWTLIRNIPQPERNDFPAQMAFSPDGRIFAGTHSRSIVRLYAAATGQVLADFEAPNSSHISSLAFNHDGTLLAVCESRDALRVWDLQKVRQNLAAMGLDWDMPPFLPGTNSWPVPHPVANVSNSPVSTGSR